MAEEQRRKDPTLLINVLADKPEKPTITKAEARRIVAGKVLTLAMYENFGVYLAKWPPIADKDLIREAFNELIAELRKRSEKRKR